MNRVPKLNRRRIRPSSLLLKLMGLTLVLSAVVAVATLNHMSLAAPLQQLGTLTLLAVVLFALLDLWRSRRTPDLLVERHMPRNLSLGRKTTIELRFRLEGNWPKTVEVFDLVPDAAQFSGLPAKLGFQSGNGGFVRYRATPQERGDITFSGVDLRYPSRWGLWDCQGRYPVQTRARVYPDFAALAGIHLAGVVVSAHYPGIRTRQRRGEGTEFHQLRDYRQGDLMRQIDWKATSRRIRLVSREYQEDRDQNLVLLLDCGNRMNTRVDNLSHFDHALNAALYLSHVALREGDSVAMLSFGQQTRWVPPVKGAGRISALLNQFYDLYPGTLASDYILAAENLMARQKKRALVMLITNLRDEDSADLRQFTQLVSRRHLVFVASLREPLVDQVMHQPVHHLEDALRLGSAADFLQQREQMATLMRAQGVLMADATPQQLTASLVNHYLDIKRSRAL